MKLILTNKSDENRPADIDIFAVKLQQNTSTKITPIKVGIIAGIFSGAIATLILALTGQLPPLSALPTAELVNLTAGAIAQITLPMALGAGLSVVVIVLLIRSYMK